VRSVKRVLELLHARPNWRGVFNAVFHRFEYASGLGWIFSRDSDAVIHFDPRLAWVLHQVAKIFEPHANRGCAMLLCRAITFFKLRRHSRQTRALDRQTCGLLLLRLHLLPVAEQVIAALAEQDDDESGDEFCHDS
jgi:hypothetical protein